MTFNTNEFRAKLKKGGARPSLFRVTIKASPPGISTGLDTTQFSFMCRAASLPNVNLGIVEVPYMGKTIKLGGDRTFEEWTVSVINDETFDLRTALEKWQSAINSISGEATAQRNSGATSSPNSYISDIMVEQFSKEGGKAIKTYTFKNAFPMVVGQIELDWEAVNAIEMFDVVWAYDYFEPSKV